MQLAFFVSGKPIEKGSWKTFPGKDGKARFVPANPKLRNWEASIKLSAANAKNEQCPDWWGVPEETPMALDLIFFLSPPKRQKHERPIAQKADLDKLVRAVFDSLTGVLYKDDGCVVRVQASKYYSHMAPGVSIAIQED